MLGHPRNQAFGSARTSFIGQIAPSGMVINVQSPHNCIRKTRMVAKMNKGATIFAVGSNGSKYATVHELEAMFARVVVAAHVRC